VRRGPGIAVSIHNLDTLLAQLLDGIHAISSRTTSAITSTPNYAIVLAKIDRGAVPASRRAIAAEDSATDACRPSVQQRGTSNEQAPPFTVRRSFAGNRLESFAERGRDHVRSLPCGQYPGDRMLGVPRSMAPANRRIFSDVSPSAGGTSTTPTHHVQSAGLVETTTLGFGLLQTASVPYERSECAPNAVEIATTRGTAKAQRRGQAKSPEQ